MGDLLHYFVHGAYNTIAYQLHLESTQLEAMLVQQKIALKIEEVYLHVVLTQRRHAMMHLD
jgi:hypothetical protein